MSVCERTRRRTQCAIKYARFPPCVRCFSLPCLLPPAHPIPIPPSASHARSAYRLPLCASLFPPCRLTPQPHNAHANTCPVPPHPTHPQPGTFANAARSASTAAPQPATACPHPAAAPGERQQPSDVSASSCPPRPPPAPASAAAAPEALPAAEDLRWCCTRGGGRGCVAALLTVKCGRMSASRKICNTEPAVGEAAAIILACTQTLAKLPPRSRPPQRVRAARLLPQAPEAASPPPHAPMPPRCPPGSAATGSVPQSRARRALCSAAAPPAGTVRGKAQGKGSTSCVQVRVQALVCKPCGVWAWRALEPAGA